jgi:hypothetical protein
MRLSACVAVIFLVGALWAQDSPKGSDKSATAAKSATEQSQAGGAAALPELKTQKFKGILMDASCAGSTAAAPAKAEDQKEAKSASANQSSGCTVSANTKEFAIRTKDGQTYRFDAVGNDRALETFKNKKKWSDLSSAGKPITTTVSANQSGDTFTVLSVD